MILDIDLCHMQHSDVCGCTVLTPSYWDTLIFAGLGEASLEIMSDRFDEVDYGCVHR